MQTSESLDIKIDVNEEFLKAIDIIENSSRHLFLTGRAGTGKSTFLQYLCGNSDKKIIVLAPTGVAAVNIKGQTIHSFFGFKPDITLEGVSSVEVKANKINMYRKIDTIVIDEISMVRADLMDCVDSFLRLYGPEEGKPFGGIQLVFLGDLYQLAPVVRQNEREIFSTVYKSPYFFEAKVFNELNMELLEFEKNYRQKDDAFIELLNKVRTNNIEQRDIDQLNERHQSEVECDEDDFYVYLTTTNKLADKINYERVHELNEKLFEHEGVISGDFDLKSLPTHHVLELKKGAQVILLNNDSAQRWINGSIGKIIDVFSAGPNNTIIQVELSNGQRVEVEPFTWEIFHFYYNEEKDAIESRVIGSFKQFPLKLAWALTIHKSQGKTFDKVIIDVGRGAFCHGQIYVALSRCTSFEGIVLKRPLLRRDIFTDTSISSFLTEYQYKIAAKNLSEDTKRELLQKAIDNNETLEIVYLKENCEKNYRKIIPKHIRSINHAGKSCVGVEAFCIERQAHWIFRLNCILSIKSLL